MMCTQAHRERTSNVVQKESILNPCAGLFTVLYIHKQNNQRLDLTETRDSPTAGNINNAQQGNMANMRV